MTDNRSYKIWLVEEYGYEYARPVRAYTRKKVALGVAQTMAQRAEYDPYKRYRITQIDLVTHDGAHALHQDLIAAVGKNK